MGKNKTQSGMMDRETFQKKEKYPSKATGLPSDRFQDKVQTAVATDTVTDSAVDLKGGKEPASSGIVASAATAVKKKMSIRPTSDTSLNDSKIVGGVPLGDSGAVMSVAGAPASLVVGDQSRVPYTGGGFRKADRYGKKISTDNFVINNAVSEQIVTSFEQPKDLSKSPDSVQGYNGRIQFDSARAKKIYGEHPTSTLFERSIDFNGHSAVVHTTGQVIGNVPATSNYPTVQSTTMNDNGEVVVDEANAAYDVTVRKSNYLLNSLNLTIENGRIVGINFDETEIAVPDAREATESANLNWQVDANNVSKAMVKMQTELGRETTDKWSPLGYVINQPYEFGMLFHDGEAICGALTGAAYKTAAHSLSYLQNKMAKEGVRGVSSIAEWLGEDIYSAVNSEVYDAFTTDHIFSPSFYRLGSASAIVGMFDSVRKYTTKADFINQPRAFKFHLQTVDNNINPFHAKKEFYKALDKVMFFSTEDGNYNPVLPVHVTDTVKLMVPYSMNAWLQHWQNPKFNTKPAGCTKHGCFYNETGILDGVCYSYSDIRNIYEWEYVDPFIAGLCRWILRHEASIVSTYGNGSISLPIHVTNTTANMFSFMVCSASQDIAWMRNIIFRDYLFAGEQGVYVWEDLASLSELNPLFSSQYTYSDYGSALRLGSLSPVSKIRLNWPEIITPRLEYSIARRNNNKPDLTMVRSYYLPFYFNENAIDITTESGICPDNGNVMSFPLIRNGINHEAVDVLYSMTERDVRLCLDRMVTLPVLVEDVDGMAYGSLVDGAYVAESLRYDTNSDGRVVITLADVETQEDYALRDMTYLATPRELGYLFPLPMSLYKGIALSYDVSGSGRDAVVIPGHAHKVIDGTASGFAYLTGDTPEYLTSYYATGNTYSTAIDRTASLTQRWIRLFASQLVRVQNMEYVARTGIVPAIGCLVDVAYEAEVRNDDSAVINPTYTFNNLDAVAVPALYGIGAQNVVNMDRIPEGHNADYSIGKVFSLGKAIWSMLQRRFTPINAFEASFLDATDGHEYNYDDGIVCDPLEFAEYFGFSGCLASDFNQDVLERLTIKDQLGMFYFEDEFIKSSLIFR